MRCPLPAPRCTCPHSRTQLAFKRGRHHLARHALSPAPCPALSPTQVTFKRKRHYLGMHASEEEAARAYDQGAICLLVR